MKSNLRYFSLLFFALLFSIAFLLRQTDAQVTTNPGVLQVNHSWPRYVTGAWDKTQYVITPSGTFCSFRSIGFNGQLIQDVLGNRPNLLVGYINGMVIYDVDDPSTPNVETATLVDVFPAIQRQGDPELYAQRFTVFVSNDRSAPATTWTPATKTTIWQQGWRQDTFCDDFVSRWNLGGQFRFIGIRPGGPGAAAQFQTLTGGFIFIDTIGIPPAKQTPVIADFTANPTSGLVPLNVQFTDITTGGPTSWAWNFGDGDVDSIQNPSHNYRNSGIFTVTLTASNASGTDAEVKTNLINAIGANPPVANFTGDPLSGLAPLDVSFTDTSTGQVTSWAWDFGDGNISSEQNPSNTYTMSGIFSVSLIVGGSNGSANVFKTNLVSVIRPRGPVAEFTADPTTGFVPLEVSFTDTSTGNPTSHAWDFGDGDVSDEPNPTKVFENAGLYNVALTVSNANGTDEIAKLNIINAIAPAGPRAAFTVDKSTGFVPLDVQFTDQSTGNATSWSWSFGDGDFSSEQNPAHTYRSPGIYSVNLTVSSSNGASQLNKTNLIIATGLNGPQTDFSASVTSGLTPLPVDFSDKSTGKPGNWSWDFGDGSTSRDQNPSHTFQTPGIYTVKLLTSNSSGSDLEIKTNLISVLAPKGPTAGFTANPTAGFAPLEVQFTDVSAGDPASFVWDFGDGNTSSVQNPANTYNKAGFFTVSLTASNKDGSSVETNTNLVNIFGAGGPRADFSADVTSGFAPLAVQFTDLSTGSPASFAWDFGDGNISSTQNPKNTYNKAGLFTVKLTVSSSSGASSEIKTNLINAIGIDGPVAAFSADPTSGLKPLSVVFKDLSSGNPTAWAWDFGDGNTSSKQNPSNIYNIEGLYTVGLTVSNDKGASSEIKTNLINVTSGSGPQPNFSANPTSGLAPLAVTFTDLSSGSPTTWAWDFGNGNVSSVQNPTNTYNVAGLFSPSLTVSNAEGANTKVQNNLINVQAVGGPVADFSANPTVGAKPLKVKFTDLTTSSPTSWVWSFGDGGSSSDQNPEHTYNVEGFFTVKLIASNANGASTQIKQNLINVIGSGPPVAAFSATPTAGIAPLTVQFTDLSEGAISSWSWTFGDGGTSSQQNPSHTYKVEGLFTVKLTVSGSEGASTETKTNLIFVQSIGTPQADFKATPQTGTAPLTVRFTDLSEPVDLIDSWLWDFGDGATSRDQNPSHNYRRDGFFSVRLTVSNSAGADSEAKTNLINILPVSAPQANFAASPTAGLSPLAVQFTDLSEPEGAIDSWLWDFGDGGTSITQNPSHTYRGTEGGFFSVSLTVSNASGADSERKTNLIQIKGVGAPIANFSASPTVGQVPLLVRFTDLSEPAGSIDSWLWDFGDGGSSINSNPEHKYRREGFFTVGLTVSNSGGADSEVKTNLIKAEGLGTPVANFSASPTAGQSPLSVAFTDLSEPAGLIDSFLWEFGDGATATQQSPSHVYQNEGFFTVGLTVSNSGGADTERKTNLIFVKGVGVPAAEFEATPTAGQPPLDVQFTDKSEGDISSWLWSFGDGATSAQQNPKHTYVNTGIFTVSLGVSGSGGADSEKKTNLIGVFEAGKVEAQFKASPQIGAVPLTVTFTDNSTGDINSWLWDFGDGATSIEQNPVHDYVNPGDFTVKLTVSGTSNTDDETKTNFIRVISDEPGSFAAFFDYEPVLGFAPVDIQFFDQTEGVDIEISSWDWDFGDGSSGEGETPLHTYNASSGETESEFDVSLTVEVDGKTDTFTIKDAVKVVESAGGCQAIMSIKPDPLNSKSRGTVKASIALSEGCLGGVNDIICDSLELEGAKATSCKIRRGELAAKFNVKDLDIQPGDDQTLTLTGETTEGDVFTATDKVDVK